MPTVPPARSFGVNDSLFCLGASLERRISRVVGPKAVNGPCPATIAVIRVTPASYAGRARAVGHEESSAGPVAQTWRRRLWPGSGRSIRNVERCYMDISDRSQGLRRTNPQAVHKPDK